MIRRKRIQLRFIGKLSGGKVKKDNKVKTNNLKQLIIGMIALDLLAILNLVLQIYLNDVSYFSFVLIIICNLVVFIMYRLNNTNKNSQDYYDFFVVSFKTVSKTNTVVTIIPVIIENTKLFIPNPMVPHKKSTPYFKIVDVNDT